MTNCGSNEFLISFKLKPPGNKEACTLQRKQPMESFEEILEQYEPMIYACIRKLRIYKNHSEFVQAGRVGLWKAAQRYDMGRGDFAPFAYRSIFGSILDELKKSYAYEQQTVPTEGDVLERIIGCKEEVVELSKSINEALFQLNHTEQQLIRLLFIEGYSLDEVACRLGMTKESLKKKRQRTLKKLKNSLMVPSTETFMLF